MIDFIIKKEKTGIKSLRDFGWRTILILNKIDYYKIESGWFPKKPPAKKKKDSRAGFAPTHPDSQSGALLLSYREITCLNTSDLLFFVKFF